MRRVLIVDDEAAVRFTLSELLLERGHEPVAVGSAAEALEKLEGVEAVITDLSMPEMDGLQLLRALRERDPQLPVVFLTAHGSERAAVSAIKAGAYDYLTKPFDIDEVALVVERALEAQRLRALSRRVATEQAIGRRIVGDSPVMRRLLEAATRVAGRDVAVLVQGETGTGKELVAALLHAQSRRARAPLIRFNCAAIPPDLAEAELFGHARGAFTGAVGARRGFFAQADGGTLFLDELGDLTLSLQAKLLRAIQEGEIQPVGAGRIEKVDVRLIAATHRDLVAEVQAGRFREDLYYRIAVVELRVPSLRERREDIVPLASEFASRYATRFGLQSFSLAAPLMAHLAAAPWPGNVRQLENAIARLAALSAGGEVGLEALSALSAAPAAAHDEHDTPDGAPSLREQVEAFERNLLARALAASGGNQSEAARRLGTSRVTLIDKLKKYGLVEGRGGG